MKKLTFIFLAFFTLAASGQIDQGNRLIKGNLNVGGTSTLKAASSTVFTVDNLRLDLNTLSTINTNGNLILAPNGTGAVQFPGLTASTVPYLDSSKNLVSSAVTDTQLGYLGNATSNICGISQACTLTNKTLSSPTITNAVFTGSIGLGASYANKLLGVDTFGNVGASVASVAEAAQLVGVTSSLCGINQVCTQTNKTFTVPTIDVLNLDDQASTPSSPASGFYKIYAKTDGKMYLLNSLGAETAIGSGAGGGSGGINYIANPDAVTDTIGWTTYDDASATLVDGTGGTFDSTFTRTTSASEVVRQNSIVSGSFKFAKGAANRQGEGVCYSFPIDRIDFPGTTQRISFDYFTSSGYASDDMYVAVYAYADAAKVIPARNADGGFIKAATNGTTPGRFEAFFEPDNLNLNYRACLHVRTTSATAYDLFFDNFQVGPQKSFPSATITNWQPYTSTLTAFGTVSTQSFEWRQVGENLEVRGYFISGTPTASVASMTLPSGLTTQTKVLQTVGKWERNAIGTNTPKGGTIVFASASNVVNFAAITELYTQSALNAQNGDQLVASGQYMSINFSVPIQGWTAGNVLAADAFNSSVATFFSNKTANQVIGTTAATKVTWATTPLVDNLRGYDSANNRYVIQRSGKYLINTQIGFDVDITSGSSALVRLYVNGVQVKAANAIVPTYGTVTVNAALELKQNDYVELFVESVDGNYTIGQNLVTFLNITQQPDFTTYGVLNKAPTMKIISASGTYTTPAGVKYLRVKVIGGGGGGAGSTAGPATGGTAGNGSSFGTSLISATGGAAGAANGAQGGTPGAATVNAPAFDIGSTAGGYGDAAHQSNGAFASGGMGGASCMGGGGSGGGGTNIGAAGYPGAAWGSGGGGGGYIGNAFAGAGGGAGGCAYAQINSPSASYPVVVGASAPGGPANGGGGHVGGQGQQGMIYVEEFY